MKNLNKSEIQLLAQQVSKSVNEDRVKINNEISEKINLEFKKFKLKKDITEFMEQVYGENNYKLTSIISYLRSAFIDGHELSKSKKTIYSTSQIEGLIRVELLNLKLMDVDYNLNSVIDLICKKIKDKEDDEGNS